MQGRRIWIATAAASVLLSLAGCSNSGSGSTSATTRPVMLEPVSGSADLHRVIFSARAVDRVGLTTAAVTPGPPGANGTTETIIPYAAVLYDPGGATWVYTNVGPRSYQRYPITVDRIDGDQTYLSAGPPVGTQVVTVGAAEVYGSEFLSEHE